MKTILPTRETSSLWIYRLIIKKFSSLVQTECSQNRVYECIVLPTYLVRKVDYSILHVRWFRNDEKRIAIQEKFFQKRHAREA